MKLLFISPAFPPMRAGESEHALRLCWKLADRGLDVHVVTTKGCSVKEAVPFKIHPIMHKWSWWDGVRLSWLVRREAPDAVLLMYTGWLYADHPMITFAPTVLKRIVRELVFVTQMENDKPSYLITWSNRLTRKLAAYLCGSSGAHYEFGTLLRDSDVVIALSQQHLENFAPHIPATRSRSIVIPPPPLLNIVSSKNGVIKQKGREILGFKSADFVLAFYGYADRNKGIETLFEALRLVREKYLNIHLIMIGGGRGSVGKSMTQEAEKVMQYEKELQNLPAAIGIADAVTWLPGYASDSEDASVYLHAADACVLPFDQGVTLSRSSLAAAVSHGLPVVSTQVECVETPFRHGENILLCPPKNAQALAENIFSLLADHELYQRLCRGSRQLAATWFSWDKAIEETIHALKGPAGNNELHDEVSQLSMRSKGSAKQLPEVKM